MNQQSSHLLSIPSTLLRFVLSAALLIAFVVPASAGSHSGVKMSDTTTVGGESLKLNGMALRKKLIFKVYVAGLYLPSAQSNGAAVLKADTPRHLVMEWLRDVDKEAICGGWYEGLEANTANPSAELKKSFDQLCGWMSAVSEGDRFAFTYLPGKGTTVTVKGKEKGTVPGKEFADALFASWIGPKPGPGEDFKQDLLGN